MLKLELELVILLGAVSENIPGTNHFQDT